MAALVLTLGLFLQAPQAASDEFWSRVAEIRAIAKNNTLDYDEGEKLFVSWKADGLERFWKELVQRVDESYRWDIWAIGSLLEGNLDPEFFLGVQLLFILQGREFYEGVLKDPASATKVFTPDTPSTQFNLYYLRTAALNANAKVGGGVLVDPQKKRTFPFNVEPRGKKWHWRDLKTLHPELWERYFVKRDRKPRLPDLKSLEDHAVMDAASDPLRDWIDIYSEPDYYLAQIGTLSRAQRCLVAVWWMQSEVNNGGFDQFFSNSTGIVATEALDGAKLFGAEGVEAGLSKIMAAFPGGAPSRDHEKRNAQMEARWKGKSSEDEFKVPWKDMAKLPARIAEYIRANPREFFRAK